MYVHVPVPIPDNPGNVNPVEVIVEFRLYAAIAPGGNTKTVDGLNPNITWFPVELDDTVNVPVT